MGVSCSNEISPVFNIFRKYGKSIKIDDQVKFIKFKQMVGSELETLNAMLSYLESHRNANIEATSSVLSSMYKKYINSYQNEFNDHCSNEIVNHHKNLESYPDDKIPSLNIDGLGLQFSWQRELARIVNECCSLATSLTEAGEIYNKKDYNQAVLQTQALNNLGWYPHYGVVSCWIRNSY